MENKAEAQQRMRDRRNDEALVVEFRARYEGAKSLLAENMSKHGLKTEDGWRISETTRVINGRTEIILHPIHLRLPPPDGLECVVSIDQTGSSEAHCASGP